MAVCNVPRSAYRHGEVGAVQDIYVKLIFVAEMVVDAFDVPPTVNGFTMNAERILTCKGKGRQLSQLRIAVLALAYDVFEMCDKDVKSCLKTVVGTCAHKKVMNRCRRYQSRDAEYNRRYAVARRRLINDVWQASEPMRNNEAHAID